MAGHSHWAGIKHKKGRADKERSKIFSKLSREITVASKLGDKWKRLKKKYKVTFGTVVTKDEIVALIVILLIM